MTTIFSISTKTFSHTTLRRCVLGAAFLLVMVNLQSCRTAAISATALDLNNYQTGKTLAQEKLAVTTVLAYTPSVISGVSNLSHGQVGKYVSAIPTALTAQVGCELPLAKTWQTGGFMQLSSTTLLDWDAGLRGYIKKELTDSLSPFSASILTGASIQWGTESRTKDVSYPPLWYNGPPLAQFSPNRDTTITITDSEISSQVNRIHIALPMSWRIQGDSTTQSYFTSTEYWTDICITPAIHLVHQNVYLQDSSYSMISSNRVETRTPTKFAGTRHIITPYIIPSLSIGVCFHASVADIFPEVTVAWTNNALTFGAGISIRGILSK